MGTRHSPFRDCFLGGDRLPAVQPDPQLVGKVRALALLFVLEVDEGVSPVTRAPVDVGGPLVEVGVPKALVAKPEVALVGGGFDWGRRLLVVGNA